MEDYMGRPALATSCMATVLDIGNPNNYPCLIVGYIGGFSDDKKWNVWWDDIENSVYIDDIFYNYTNRPKKPGFYVWEGTATPQYDDAPVLDGTWRTAIAEDFVNFQQVTE